MPNYSTNLESSVTVSPAARRRIAAAFGVTLMLLAVLAVIGVAVAGPTIQAATYSLTSTAPLTVWSDSTKWSGGPPGTYPGQNAGDVANVNLAGAYTITVNTVIPNSVQVS